MAESYTTKNITSVGEVNALENSDKIFINDSGAVKQISVSNLIESSGVLKESQGAENEGKYLGINDNGEVVPTAIPVDKSLNKSDIPADSKTVGDSIAKLASGIILTDQGSSLQIEGTADAPVARLKVYGKGIQNGTPTPDVPAEIEIPGSEGNIELQILSANIYNNSERNFSSNVQTSSILEKTDTGLKFEIIKAGTSAGVFKSDVFPDNFSGYVSFDVVVSNLDFQYFVSCFENRTESSDFSAGRSKHIAFKLEEYNSKSLTFYLNTETTGTVVEIKNIMITTGNEDREFQPYSYSAITFSTPNGLPGIPVDSDGNYTDSNGQQWICDEVDFGRGKYVQRVQKVDLGDITFNNNNAWTNMQENFVFAYSSNLFSYSDMVLSDKLQSIKYTGNVTSINNESIMAERNSSDPSKGRLYIVIKKERIGEVSTVGVALNSYLKTAGISVLCKIDEVETDLSEEELAAYAALRTNYPTTVVTSDSDPAVDMEIEYVADTKTYIDNKFAELAQNLAATQNTLLEV